MDLTDKLRVSALVDLSRVAISELSDYARKNKSAITALYEHKVIDDSMIDKALRIAIINQSRKDYQTITSGKFTRDMSHPEHRAKSVESFAYALSIGVFSDQELKRIPFEHDQNPDSFIKMYLPEDLVSKFRKEYLNPTPAIVDKEPSCMGCCCSECP